MDAQLVLRLAVALVGLLGFSSASHAQWPRGPLARPQAQLRSENFIVVAANPELARQVLDAAESMRHDLAVHWLGQPLPRWPAPCPITVLAGPKLGAGGSTSFTMGNGHVANWRMNVQGSVERILDSVLPHEITHTILATHFAVLGVPVPRWADEGACTTVEHASERAKHDHFLVEFLSQGRGIPFATMFTLRDYPADIMPLYAQGYSVSAFLIAQGGPRRFVQFLEDGMKSDDWVRATEKHYGYPKIGKLQTAWNQWVSDGGGAVDGHTALAMGLSTPASTASAAPGAGSVALASATRPIDRSVVDNPLTLADEQPLRRSDAGTSWYRQQLEQHAQVGRPAEISGDYSAGHPQPIQTLIR